MNNKRCYICEIIHYQFESMFVIYFTLYTHYNVIFFTLQ